MTIYLVRHTEYANPENIFAYHLPLPLSEEGIKQAERAAEWFKQNGVESIPIFASPIKRAQETAEIISKKISSQISTDNRLIEAFCPNLQGKKIPEPVEDAWKIESADTSHETSEHCQERMLDIFMEKVKEGQNCILVSHGDPLTALYYYLVKKPLVHCLFGEDYMDIYVKRGEIVKVTIHDNNYSVERYTP
jgi:broad specificity phosphatase PhoE